MLYLCPKITKGGCMKKYLFLNLLWMGLSFAYLNGYAEDSEAIYEELTTLLTQGALLPGDCQITGPYYRGSLFGFNVKKNDQKVEVKISPKGDFYVENEEIDGVTVKVVTVGYAHRGGSFFPGAGNVDYELRVKFDNSQKIYFLKVSEDTFPSIPFLGESEAQCE